MKIFDFERAYNLVMSCTDIFGREWISVERINKHGDPCLRISYKDISLDFRCYKYC